MIGKKLIKLLAALDSIEFRRMRKLFQSPIYTSNPHHLKLYDYLRRYYPNFDSLKLEKKIVFEKVFENETFNDWKLRSLVSEFTQLTEEYLIILDNRANEIQRKKQLTHIYGKRNLYHIFEQNTKRLLADLEALPHRNMDYYLQKMQLNEVWYFHPMKNTYDLKDTSLEDLMDSLDQYFTLAKMRFGIAMKNVEKILSKDYDLKFLKIIEEEVISKENSAFFQLYHLIFKLVTEQNNEYFEEVEQLLFQEIETLRLDDKQLLFQTCLNFINRQINNGKPHFSKKAFIWNEFGLAHGLFIHHQIINENIFGNIIVIACREKQFDWTKSFIESYQIYLDDQIKDDAVNYNLGILYFYQEDYEQAISVLMNSSFSPSYALRSRLFIIRIMFKSFLKDIEYFSVLISNIQSFEIYLLRNKYFSKSKLKPHLNFIRTIKKIARKLLNNIEKEVIQEWLIKELNSSKIIGGKNWLLEIINDEVV